MILSDNYFEIEKNVKVTIKIRQRKCKIIVL